MTPQAPAIHSTIHAQVIIARQEALRVRAHTDDSYTKLAKSSAKLEQRIKNNQFHITRSQSLDRGRRRCRLHYKSARR